MSIRWSTSPILSSFPGTRMVPLIDRAKMWAHSVIVTSWKMCECAHIFPLSINGTIRVPGNDDKMGKMWSHSVIVTSWKMCAMLREVDGHVMGHMIQDVTMTECAHI